MANTVIAIRSSGTAAATPSLGVLANGELSLNFADGIIYYKTSSNTLGSIKTTQPAGLTTEVQFNDSGSFGGDSGFTYNKTTNTLTIDNVTTGGLNVAPTLQASFNQANSVFLPSVTRLNVTNDGSAAYLFDQYTGNNPTLYVIAGETIAFSLNVTGHPFMIRVSSGGTNYNTGLTHVSTDGTVLTNAAAQGQVTGTLYWKVPAELASNNYVYQCSIHGGMVGPIRIGQPNTIILTQANAAFDKANSANILAQAAFDFANTISGGDAAAAFDKANAANVLAQAAFNNSNTKFNSSGGTISGNVFVTGSLFPSVDNTGEVGNTAFTWNNGQFTNLTVDSLLTVTSTLNVRAAIDLADFDILRFGTGDDWEMFHDGTANRIDLTNGDLTIRDDGTAGDPTRFTFGRTTGAFTANGNVSATNFLVGSLNVNEHAQSAFSQANSANVLAQAAFDFANTVSGGAAIDNVARTTATAAFLQANAAFGAANSANVFDYTTVSATAGTYGNSTYYPIVTVAANGRVTNVSSQISASSGASIGDVLALAIALG